MTFICLLPFALANGRRWPAGRMRALSSCTMGPRNKCGDDRFGVHDTSNRTGPFLSRLRERTKSQSQSARLLQLNLDERVFRVIGVDHVVFHALVAKIGNAFLYLGEACALFGLKRHLAVHERHNDIVVAVDR